MSVSETSSYLPQTVSLGGRPPRRLLLGMMVAVFFSGGVIGSGSTLMLINRRIEANQKHRDVVSVSARIVPDLQEALSLSEPQTAQVERIMKEHLAALSQIRQDVFFPMIKDQFKQMEDQVNAVLDDEQRSQWHAWLDERRKRVCPPGEHRRHGHSRYGRDANGRDANGRDAKREGSTGGRAKPEADRPKSNETQPDKA